MYKWKLIWLFWQSSNMAENEEGVDSESSANLLPETLDINIEEVIIWVKIARGIQNNLDFLWCA